MADPEVISAGTAEGLLAFCDYLVQRGIAPASAVNPWKSAAKNVFAKVEGTEDFGALDVRALDVDDYMMRYAHKSRGSVKPETVAAYDNRFRKAVFAYIGYLADPMGWRPNIRSVTRKPAAN